MELKIGSQILVSSPYSTDLLVVKRETKTQWVAEGKDNPNWVERFKKDNPILIPIGHSTLSQKKYKQIK
jgi:hypothetical protein